MTASKARPTWLPPSRRRARSSPACARPTRSMRARQPGAAKALAAAGAIVHLAGRPGENEQSWRQAGVKDFIYMGCDVLSTLQAVHDILDIK